MALHGFVRRFATFESTEGNSILGCLLASRGESLVLGVKDMSNMSMSRVNLIYDKDNWEIRGAYFQFGTGRKGSINKQMFLGLNQTYWISFI